MSYTIEDSKFVIFGNGHDGTSIDSGEGETTPPEPPTPPLEGYLFKYGQIRPMEQYSINLPTNPAGEPVNLSKISYTGGLCYFALQQISRTGTLPTFGNVKTFIRSVTDKTGGSSPNTHIGSIIPLSRTDTGSKIIGIIDFYATDNSLYRLATWVVYDEQVGHWDVLYDSFFTVSYTYEDWADDNSMVYTLVNDGTWFRIAKHHSNPTADTFVGARVKLSDYDFYYWS